MSSSSLSHLPESVVGESIWLAEFGSHWSTEVVANNQPKNVCGVTKSQTADRLNTHTTRHLQSALRNETWDFREQAAGACLNGRTPPCVSSALEAILCLVSPLSFSTPQYLNCPPPPHTHTLPKGTRSDDYDDHLRLCFRTWTFASGSRKEGWCCI